MSILPMKRKCPKCGKSISFNPDVGKLALICPKCKAVLSTEQPLTDEEAKRISQAIKALLYDKK